MLEGTHSRAEANLPALLPTGILPALQATTYPHSYDDKAPTATHPTSTSTDCQHDLRQPTSTLREAALRMKVWTWAGVLWTKAHLRHARSTSTPVCLRSEAPSPAPARPVQPLQFCYLCVCVRAVSKLLGLLRVTRVCIVLLCRCCSERATLVLPCRLANMFMIRALGPT